MNLVSGDAMIHQVKVTEIRIKKPFLKIFVQNIKCPNYQKIQCLEHVYKTLQYGGDIGDLCVIKSEGEFHRCRVLDIIFCDHHEKALLYFIDSGFTTTFPRNHLRLLPESNFFYLIPPLCKPFYVAGLMMDTSVPDYRDKIKNKVNNFLRNKIVNLSVAGEIPPISLARLEIKGHSFIDDIIFNDPVCAEIFKTIEVRDQLNQLTMVTEPRLNIEILPESPEEKKAAPIVKTTEKQTFPVGSKHDVKVIECKNGPKEFYVNFTSPQDAEKQKSFYELLREAILEPLRADQLKDLPIGSQVIYLLCCKENKKLDALRGTVLKVENINQIKIFLIDMGREIIAKYSNLYVTKDKKVLDTPPFAIKFTLHNLHSATHLDKDELNFYFRRLAHNRVFKITITAPKNQDHLECSLRTSEHNKDVLALIKAYDPRALTYPKQFILKPGEYKVIITAIESSNSFYVTLLEKQDFVVANEMLLEQLNACELKNPSPGNVCYVKIDKKFHRGRFLKRVSPLICEVQLVDYGTIYKVRHNDVKAMVDDFVIHPPAAYHCCLSETNNLENFKKYLNQKTSITVESFQNEMYYVKVMKEPNAMKPNAPQEVEEDIEMQVEKPTASTRKETGWENENDWSVVDKRVVDDCTISRVTSVNDFTITTNADSPNWSQIILNTSLREADYARENEIYLIQDPNNREWVRVALLKIEQFGNKEVQTLRNIDDGTIYKNELPIYKDVYEIYDKEKQKIVQAVLIKADKNNDKTLKSIEDGSIIKLVNAGWEKLKESHEWYDTIKLYEAPIDVRMVLPNAIRCSLLCIANKHYEQEANEYLLNLTGQNLTFRILHANPEFNTISLFQNHQNVLDKLIALNYVSKLPILPRGTAFITHIENLKEFYMLQIEWSLTTSTIINDYTFKQYKKVPLVEPKLNQLIMAKFGEDGFWYRARILRIFEDAVNVKFVDFGNKERVLLENIGAFSEPWITQAEPVVAKCALDLPANLNPSTAAAVNFFKKFAKSGEKTFTYNFIRAEQGYSIIKIYKDGERDLLNDILPLCEEHVSSDKQAGHCDISSASEFSMCNSGNVVPPAEVSSDWST